MKLILDGERLSTEGDQNLSYATIGNTINLLYQVNYTQLFFLLLCTQHVPFILSMLLCEVAIFFLLAAKNTKNVAVFQYLS